MQRLLLRLRRLKAPRFSYLFSAAMLAASAAVYAMPIETDPIPAYLTAGHKVASAPDIAFAPLAVEDAGRSERGGAPVLRDAHGKPIKQPTDQSSADKVQSRETTTTPSPAPNPSAAMAPAKSLEAEGLDMRFDLSVLPLEEIPPPPAPPTPPPDPAAGLKKYVFVGSAKSGDRSRAMFSGPGGVMLLSEGMSLEGYVLKSFDAASARFEQGGNSFSMGLGVRN